MKKVKLRLVKNPIFKRAKEFNDTLTAYLMNPVTVTLDKPLYVGMAILDLSKILMYNYWYDVIRKKYPDARLLYTDSIVFRVETEDKYKEMNLTKYDTSNYPKGHPCFSERNKKVVGLPKDEGGGQPISKFVALRSKSYCVKFQDTELKRHKGVKKCVVKNFTIDTYRDFLLSGKNGPDCKMTTLTVKVARDRNGHLHEKGLVNL